MEYIKIPYLPDCNLQANKRNAESSDVEFGLKIEMELFGLLSGCKDVFSFASDEIIHPGNSAGNLVSIQEINRGGFVPDDYGLMVLCSICYNTLERDCLRLKDYPDDPIDINELRA